METTDPYAPIRPDQENELVQLLAAGRGRLTQDRLRKQLRGLDAGQAADKIRGLKTGTVAPLVIEPPANTTDTRATIDALRDKLDAGYAGRHMQPVGLNKPPGSIR